MDFALSEEQRMLQESLERLLKDHYDFETRGTYMQAPEGFGRELWAKYAELGLLGLPFEERFGGFGGGPVETMIVAEAFGRALALERFLAPVVLGGGLLRHGGSEEQRATLFPKIAEGSLLLAFAHSERQSRYHLADVGTTARRDGAGFVLDGAKTLVLHGDSADKLLVSARVSGERRDPQGIGLFVVDAGAKGVARRGYRTIDGQHAAEVTLTKVAAGPEAAVGDPGNAFALIRRV